MTGKGGSINTEYSQIKMMIDKSGDFSNVNEELKEKAYNDVK